MVIIYAAFEDDTMASTSQDSSFGDENSQEQDPLAMEPKVTKNRCSLIILNTLI